MWVYSIDGKVPIEIKYFNKNSNIDVEKISKSASTCGKLYLLLYSKYRDPDKYNNVRLLIDKNEIIKYKSGCVSTEISTQQAIEKIEMNKYDWVGVINE
jgi:hypothetical protein